MEAFENIYSNNSVVSNYGSQVNPQNAYGIETNNRAKSRGDSKRAVSRGVDSNCYYGSKIASRGCKRPSMR